MRRVFNHPCPTMKPLVRRSLIALALAAALAFTLAVSDARAVGRQRGLGLVGGGARGAVDDRSGDGGGAEALRAQPALHFPDTVTVDALFGFVRGQGMGQTPLVVR
jgi:hypothetical protein